MRSIYTKTMYDRRSFVIGWTLGMFVFAMLMTSFYPAMHQQGALDQLVKQLPPAMQGLVGNLANLSQFNTYIASQLFDIRLPLIGGIMAIILSLGLSTREEEDGELRTILALPISRSKLLFEKWLALCTIIFATTIGLIAGVYAILPFLSDASIEPIALLRLAAMTLLIMIAYGTVAYAAGMASGRRGVASFVGIVVIIGSFLLSTFSQAVDWLQAYEKFSLLHYFPAVDIVKTGIEPRDVSVLLGVTIVSLFIAWIIFRRRDIA
jgi:ABC-2 type transport system permease protein